MRRLLIDLAGLLVFALLARTAVNEQPAPSKSAAPGDAGQILASNSSPYKLGGSRDGPDVWIDDMAALPFPDGTPIPLDAATVERLYLLSAEAPAYYLRLDAPESNAAYDLLPGKAALGLAAQLYAVASRDYSVTLTELMATGFWPYDLVPAGVDANTPISERFSPALDASGSLDSAVLARVGTLDWMFHAHRRILQQYHLSVQRDAGQWRSEEFEASRKMPFWMNVYTGEPCRESQEPGDYTYVQVDGSQSIMRGKQDAGNAALMPVLNVREGVASQQPAAAESALT